MDTLNADKTKNCPICGNLFGCSPLDCWCSKLPTIMPMDENGACYCPNCLGNMIDERQAEKK